MRIQPARRFWGQKQGKQGGKGVFGAKFIQFLHENRVDRKRFYRPSYGGSDGYHSIT